MSGNASGRAAIHGVLFYEAGKRRRRLAGVLANDRSPVLNLEQLVQFDYLITFDPEGTAISLKRERRVTSALSVRR